MDNSEGYLVSKAKPKVQLIPTCGTSTCTVCTKAERYYSPRAVELCDEDFEAMLGKGLKEGINRIEVTVL